MAYRLIIEGNSVYEIDEECEREKKRRRGSGISQHQTEIFADLTPEQKNGKEKGEKERKNGKIK